MGKALPLVVAAFLTGLGAGYLLRPDAPPARGTVRRIPTAPVDPEAPAAGGPMRTISERLASAPVDPIPTGDGRITGSVTDPQGGPVSGALVVATPHYDWSAAPGTKRHRGVAAPPSLDWDLEEAVRTRLAYYRWMHEARRQARTDPDGFYRIEKLAPGKHSLIAYVQGCEVVAKAGSNAYQAMDGDRIDFVAYPLVVVPVDVRLPEGTRPREAAVNCTQRVESSSQSRRRLWTSDQRWIELRPGGYELTALVDEPGRTLRSASQAIVVKAGETPSELVFLLRERPSLRVRAVLPPGFAPQPVSIHAAALHGDVSPDPRSLLDGSLQAGARRINNLETIRLWSDLPPGAYLVGASFADPKKIDVSRVVEVRRGTTTVTLEMPPPDPAAFVHVRVLDPGGDLLSGAKLRPGYRSDRGWGTKTVPVLRLEDGSSLLHTFDPGPDHSNVSHFVHAVAPGYGSRDQDYEPGRAEEVVLRFEDPALVEVTVAGFAGRGLQGALRIGLRSRGSSNAGRRYPGYGGRKPDEEGRLQMPPVQPGAYEIVLFAEPYGRSVPIGRTPVTLGSGNRRITIPLPQLYTLRIHVRAALSRLDLYTWNASLEVRRLVYSRGDVPEAAELACRMLPAGTYKLRAVRAGDDNRGRWIDLSIPARSEISIE